MSNTEPTILDSGNGQFIGNGITQASTPDDLRRQQAAINAALNPQQVTMTPPVPSSSFTEADIERARREEKDKVYPQIEEMRKTLDSLKAERDAEQAEKQRQIDEAEAARKAAEDEKLTLTQRLTRVEQETQDRFNKLEQERSMAVALMEKERQFSALREFTSAHMAAEIDNIIPELRDYVGGNSEEEILASIEAAKQRSASILQGLVQAQQQTWQGMRGTMPTAPAAGPLENMGDTRQLSDQDIAAMDMATYTKNRGQLLRAASAHMRGQG